MLRPCLLLLEVNILVLHGEFKSGTIILIRTDVDGLGSPQYLGRCTWQHSIELDVI